MASKHDLHEDISVANSAKQTKRNKTSTSMGLLALDPVATIHVGKGLERKTFHVHIELLKEKSEYFRGALSHTFIEGIAKEVSLPEDSPVGFVVFVEWAYSGRISTTWKSAHLVRAWIVGDKLMCFDLQNEALKRWKCRTRGVDFHVWALALIEENDLQDSELKRYMVDELAFLLNQRPSAFEAFPEAHAQHGELNTRTMLDVMRRLQFYGNVSHALKVSPSSTKAPDYHVGVKVTLEDTGTEERP